MQYFHMVDTGEKKILKWRLVTEGEGNAVILAASDDNGNHWHYVAQVVCDGKLIINPENKFKISYGGSV